MHTEIRVFRMTEDTEKDIKAKSGKAKAMLVLLEDGSIHMYHSGSVHRITEFRHVPEVPGEKNSARKVIKIVHEGMSRGDDNEKKFHDKLPAQISERQDKNLTQTTITKSDAQPPVQSAEIANIVEHVTSLAYLKLKNSCCISGSGWEIYC